MLPKQRRLGASVSLGGGWRYPGGREPVSPSLLGLVEGAGINVLKVKQKSQAGPVAAVLSGR